LKKVHLFTLNLSAYYFWRLLLFNHKKIEYWQDNEETMAAISGEWEQHGASQP
jgi:hypothetical protein